MEDLLCRHIDGLEKRGGGAVYVGVRLGALMETKELFNRFQVLSKIDCTRFSVAKE